MFNYYSGYSYVNNRSNLLKLNLFLKQISLNLAIFGKNESNYRDKKLCIYNTPLWKLNSSDWILNSSNNWL